MFWELAFLVGLLCMAVGVAIGLWLDDSARPDSDPYNDKDNWGM